MDNVCSYTSNFLCKIRCSEIVRYNHGRSMDCSFGYLYLHDFMSVHFDVTDLSKLHLHCISWLIISKIGAPAVLWFFFSMVFQKHTTCGMIIVGNHVVGRIRRRSTGGSGNGQLKCGIGVECSVLS